MDGTLPMTNILTSKKLYKYINDGNIQLKLSTESFWIQAHNQENVFYEVIDASNSVIHC